MPKIVKSCLNLSKLRPKYYRSIFFGHGVYSAHFCSTRKALVGGSHSLIIIIIIIIIIITDLYSSFRSEDTEALDLQLQRRFTCNYVLQVRLPLPHKRSPDGAYPSDGLRLWTSDCSLRHSENITTSDTQPVLRQRTTKITFISRLPPCPYKTDPVNIRSV